MKTSTIGALERAEVARKLRMRLRLDCKTVRYRGYLLRRSHAWNDAILRILNLTSALASLSHHNHNDNSNQRNEPKRMGKGHLLRSVSDKRRSIFYVQVVATGYLVAEMQHDAKRKVAIRCHAM